MSAEPLTVAWVSSFPIEWLPDLPSNLGELPRLHPATWQRVLLARLEGCPGLRLHVVVLRKHFRRSATFERRGVVFHLIKTLPFSRAPSMFWCDTFLTRRVLKQIKPDLVHAWGTESGAALVASRLGFPYLITMQGLMSWLAEIVPLNRHDRWITFCEKASLSRASVVTAESNFAISFLKARFPHLDLRKIEHAPQTCFHEVCRRPTAGPFHFLFVGTLSYGKGADLLFRAFDSLKEELSFSVTVVGTGDESWLRRLKQSISPALWKRVTFRHNLTSEEVSETMEVATMLIFPSRADNSPNAVKEAVVAGLPVIASDIGGIPDYVFHGKNGLLFPPNNLAGCIQAIRDATSHCLFRTGMVDPDTLVQTRAYLSPERMGRAFFETYQRVSCPTR
jgi:glycosyltransferase involved in cell wall biosynthesis